MLILRKFRMRLRSRFSPGPGRYFFSGRCFHGLLKNLHQVILCNQSGISELPVQYGRSDPDSSCGGHYYHSAGINLVGSIRANGGIILMNAHQ